MMKIRSIFPNVLRRPGVYGLDTRSLSLFRIAISLLILADLFLRLQSYSQHYTEAGISPIRWLCDRTQNPLMNWSVFFLHFSEGWTVCVFALIALSATGLLVGFHTKFFSISTWVFVVSLQAKNPIILFGADSLLAVLLFWGMWLPLGCHWSIDSRKQVSPPSLVCSAASLAITVQVALVYWMNAITKGGVEWRGDYTAIERTLRIDYFSTSFGEYLLRFPELLKTGTQFTLYLEELVPFLLFLPFFRGNLKTVAVLTMVFFHVGMLGTTMHLGIFPFIGAIAWLPFLPSSFWERFAKAPLSDSSLRVLRSPWYANVVCLSLMVFVILWNVRHVLRQDDPWFFPKSINWVGTVTRLKQRWSLFAPRVNTTDGWFIAEAILKDGGKIDLINHGKAVDFKRPDKIESRFKSCRERTYLIYLFQQPDPIRVELFVQSLRNKWTAAGGNEVQSIRLFMMHEDNREPEKGIRCFQMWPYEVETVGEEKKFKEKSIGKEAN